MPAELIRRGLLDHRRALLGWCLGVIGYTALLASIFPSFKGSADLQKLVQRYPDALKALLGLSSGSFATGPGFLDAELFSLMLPLLVLVLAIGSGARAYAGEEEAGRLELLLSYPLRRRGAVLAKGSALAGEVVVFCAVGFGSLAVLSAIFGLDLDFGRLAAAMGSLAVLGLFFGWLALALGAAFPSKVLALGISAGFAAATYLVGGLHSLAGWLDPLRFLSPFWLVGQSPLEDGVNGWGILVVLAASAAIIGAGAALSERRDLETP
ncbi:MAG TPA: ABC transporter permease subunit [Gaiellaceae bacterium]|nr:ABC transporter permease subunit [Gaiellaceae bacterium]